MIKRMKDWLYDTWADFWYPIDWDEFWEEERRQHKLDLIARDCAILEEKIKEAKRKKQRASHLEREFVLKKTEILGISNEEAS